MKAGDKSAFSSIFSYYYANLVSFANNFVHDMDSAEEIVQDVFVHLWENRDVLCISSSLKSYLLKMVQNRRFNLLKHLEIRNTYKDFALKYNNIFERDTENYILYSELLPELEGLPAKQPRKGAPSWDWGQLLTTLPL